MRVGLCACGRSVCVCEWVLTFRLLDNFRIITRYVELYISATRMQDLLSARHLLCYAIKQRRLRVVEHITDMGQLEGRASGRFEVNTEVLNLRASGI